MTRWTPTVALLVAGLGAGMWSLALAEDRDATSDEEAALADCRTIKFGTAKELTKLMRELRAEGHDDFLVEGSLLCGWH